jgi:hypothetical protein
MCRDRPRRGNARAATALGNYWMHGSVTERDPPSTLPVLVLPPNTPDNVEVNPVVMASDGSPLSERPRLARC